MSNTKQKIMDIAERAIIQGGYNAFSFRDIADEIGIKSASVHYHYPTKADLVADIMVRYTEQFQSKLPDPEEYDPQILLTGYIKGFKEKIVDQKNMSLCTMLASDKNLLPEQVSQALTGFYQISLDWLAEVCLRFEGSSPEQARVKSQQILASLHGASLLVLATGDVSMYEEIVSQWY